MGWVSADGKDVSLDTLEADMAGLEEAVAKDFKVTNVKISFVKMSFVEITIVKMSIVETSNVEMSIVKCLFTK